MLTEYVYAGQMQQRPAPRGGGMFKREWFEFVDHVPEKARRVRFWDMAGTVKSSMNQDPDYTVGTLLATTGDGRFYVEDVIRGRWSPGQNQKIVKSTAQMDGRSTSVRMEQEPGASGIEVIYNYTRALVGFNFRGRRASGAKEDNWEPFAIQCEYGNVYLLRASWNKEWLNEMCNVPFAKHDDQADSAAGGFNELTKKRVARAK